MEWDGDDAWYQCKLCSEKFNTTAELQKHKRIGHRNSNSLAPPTTTESSETLKNRKSHISSGNPCPTQERPQQVGAIEHGHGTRYSRAKNRISNNEILQSRERHLTCTSCGENFDTKDKVVLHLLRQSINEAGTVKCPFCVKVLLDGKILNLPSPTANMSVVMNKNDGAIPITNLRNVNSRSKNATSDRESSGVISTSTVEEGDSQILKSKFVPSSVNNLPIPVARQQSLRTLKRKPTSPVKLSSSQMSKRITSNFDKECSNSSLGSDSNFNAQISSKRQEIPSSPSTPERHTFKTSTPTTVPIQMDQIKRDFEIIYRQPRGKGSRGGKSGRSNGISRSDLNNTVSENGERDSVDSPLKVSVLINNSPYPSSSRLAVPKGKHFEKGNIKCPYCGFVAKSVREVQFHVNTHMAKSYPCEFCSHIYRSKQAVLNHTAKHHSHHEVAKSGIFPDHSNSDGVGREVDDQCSLSNYSSSLVGDNTEAENYFYDGSQSQDSNMENCINFPVTPAQSSYYATEIQNESFVYNQAYLASTAQAIMTDQKREHDLLLLGGLGVGTRGGAIEKVVQIANF